MYASCPACRLRPLHGLPGRGIAWCVCANWHLPLLAITQQEPLDFTMGGPDGGLFQTWATMYGGMLTKSCMCPNGAPSAGDHVAGPCFAHLGATPSHLGASSSPIGLGASLAMAPSPHILSARMVCFWIGACKPCHDIVMQTSGFEHCRDYWVFVPPHEPTDMYHCPCIAIALASLGKRHASLDALGHVRCVDLCLGESVDDSNDQEDGRTMSSPRELHRCCSPAPPLPPFPTRRIIRKSADVWCVAQSKFNLW